MNTARVINLSEYRQKKVQKINKRLEEAVFKDGGEKADIGAVMDNQLLRMYYKIAIMNDQEAEKLFLFAMGISEEENLKTRLWGICKSALMNPGVIDELEQKADNIIEN